MRYAHIFCGWSGRLKPSGSNGRRSERPRRDSRLSTGPTLFSACRSRQGGFRVSIVVVVPSTILEPKRLETYHVKSTQMLLLRISFVRDSGAIRGGRSPTRQGHRKTLVLKLSCRRVRPDECHRPCATIQPNRANARVRSEPTRVPAAQAAPQYAKPVPPAIRNIGFGRIHPLTQVRKAETHRRA